MTTQRDESAVGSAVSFGDPATRAATVQARAQRANSVPNALPAPAELHSADLVPVTEGDALQPAPAGWQEAADRAQRAFTRISSGVSVLHAQPPSLAETRERHHRAAGQWNALAMVWPRIIYGYGHLCVKALLHCIEWVLESPPRVVIAAVVIYVFLFRS